MAIRTNTIQYALPMQTASLAAGVVRVFNPLTVYIPETSSRVFKSCFVTEYVSDAGTAATPNAWRLQCAASASVSGDTTGLGLTVSGTLTNSGESQCWIFTRDVTGLFSSSWKSTETSNIFILSSSVTVNGTIFASAKLTLTYEYDDVQNTRIKTVRIPLQSSTGALSTTLVEVGAIPNQIPALDTFLPESNKIYRDIFFEIEGNDATNTAATATMSLVVGLDADSPRSASGNIVCTQASARYTQLHFKYPDMITNTSHAYKLRTTSTTGGTWDCISTILYVTYEYDHGNSSRVMNSLMFAAADDSGYMGGNLMHSQSRFEREILIEEPGPIQLVHSGITFHHIESAGLVFRPWVGSQTTQSFTTPAKVTCGSSAVTLRIDSGNTTQGSGFTSFDRGKNILTINWMRTGAAVGTLGSSLSAVAYINYTSSISSHPGGAANHAQTRMYNVQRTTGSAQQIIVQGWKPCMSAAESQSYWLMGYGHIMYVILPGTTTLGSATTLNFQINSDESQNGGFSPVYSSLYESDSESGVTVNIARCRDSFKRYNNDVDTGRLDINRARDIRIDSSNIAFVASHAFYTYHTMTYELSASVTGYTGDGSNVTMSWFRNDTNEWILSGTTTTGGKYNDIWYDNTIPVYVSAYEHTASMGRSIAATASGTP